MLRFRQHQAANVGLPKEILFGAIAGALATAPMTVLMEAGFRLLPRAERYPLPPRQIVEEFAERADTALPRSEDQRVGLTLAAHFAYGAGAGAVLGLDPAPTAAAAAARAVLFGVVVWIASYLGWLPALGVLRPATEHPIRRNALMLIAHSLWGACAGILVYFLKRDEGHRAE